jgi:hypothetical protein
MEFVEGRPMRPVDGTKKLLDLAVQIADGLGEHGRQTASDPGLVNPVAGVEGERPSGEHINRLPIITKTQPRTTRASDGP